MVIWWPDVSQQAASCRRAPVMAHLVSSTMMGVSRLSVEYIGTLRDLRPNSAKPVLAVYSRLMPASWRQRRQEKGGQERRPAAWSGCRMARVATICLHGRGRSSVRLVSEDCTTGGLKLVMPAWRAEADG